MIDIQWLISRINSEQYLLSQHADNERVNDNLLISEIEEAIVSGKILENILKTEEAAAV